MNVKFLVKNSFKFAEFMKMSEFYRTDFKDSFNENEEGTVIPTSNATLPIGFNFRYVYVIVGIYAVVLTIILIIIVAIFIKKLCDSFCPPSYKTDSGYGTISREDGGGIQANCPHRQISELNSLVDVFERSIESEYDNVSLDTSESVLVTRTTDVPPQYEHPPAYGISEPV